MKKTVILCILDGWGHSEEKKYNPILLGNTPNWDYLSASAPQSFLKTYGEAVGLSEGQMGNSEVGHLNLGAGRIICQSLPRITQAFEKDFLETYQPLNDALTFAPQSRVHILGLLSQGGVHSHQNHIAKLANHIMAKKHDCVIHAFTDGRDCPPQSALDFLSDFKTQSTAPIATISGRYFAMDRDKNWQRTAQAYIAINDGQAQQSFLNAEQAIENAYQQNITDEFIPPAIIGNYQGIKAGDIVICANFRADRVRQIMGLISNNDRLPDSKQSTAELSNIFGICSYSEQLDKKLQALFPPHKIEQTLGETISAHGKTQLRLAETEKYAHVTYFFNGGIEKPFANETRILVPSPKVATYDLQPEMSGVQVTDALCDAIENGAYDLIITNYANPDMVGHTGNLQAATQAIEFIDEMLGRILSSIDKRNQSEENAEMLLTADHGNIEIMFDEKTGNPHTAHSLNPVKLHYYGTRHLQLKDGTLADIAPSLLALMNIKQPQEMSGKCLINL